MRKILVDFPKIEIVEFKVGEKTVKVKNYITLEEEATIVATYLDIYFNSDEEQRYEGLDTHFSGAEIAFDIAVVDIATNIKVLSDNIDMGDIYSSGVMDEIRGRIINLPQIRKRLERVVADAKQERFSASGVFKEIIKEITVLAKGLDFEKIQELAKEVKALEGDIADSPIATLMDEGKK